LAEQSVSANQKARYTGWKRIYNPEMAGFKISWFWPSTCGFSTKKNIKSKHNFESGNFQTFCYFI
jgi:hypothetical protein